MASEIEIRLRLVARFPGLSQAPFDLTSDADPYYNCIAWAAGVDNEFWWPGRFWPKTAAKKVTRSAFLKAFRTKGYKVCDGPEPEVGFEKVALYEKDGKPTHAARQLPDGRWTSKLGQAQDIAHSLEGLNGVEYGEPIVFLKRAI
jgi:hypothetical protein